MAVELNHIIVPARDKHTSAAFLAGILGVEVGTAWGPFVPLPMSNGVTLDFMDAERFNPQHCAFQLSAPEFDAAVGRLQAARLPYWADPLHQQPGEVAKRFGSRAVYFEDPAGHNMEILTPAPSAG
ncbi:MAG TPA: VOC family protein [Pseudonocardia sp.]|jgi:catechol 2,3-dioxygenase-like lactoylglutathione lyase family enzyme|nr:VOC family protein [Pseudonocardia sp.]